MDTALSYLKETLLAGRCRFIAVSAEFQLWESRNSPQMQVDMKQHQCHYFLLSLLLVCLSDSQGYNLNVGKECVTVTMTTQWSLAPHQQHTGDPIPWLRCESPVP